jgi:ribokinase
LNSLPGARITVVGSFAVGLTMKLNRFPERGETLLGTGYRVDHGGKGSNQAVGCARLGAKVSLVARVGTDSFGRSGLELYDREGVDTTCVRQVPDLPTGVGFILVRLDTGENRIVVDPGANSRLTRQAVLESKEALASAGVVLAQLEIPVEAADAAMEAGRACGAITILNPAPAHSLPPETLEKASVVTPNETEAKAMLGHDPHAVIPPERLAREIMRLGARQVVVTLGGQGAIIVTESLEIDVPAIDIPVVDTTGAGDAFNAGLAVALANGSDLESAVHLAVVTGALAVTKEGVIPSLPYRDQVLACLERNRLPVPHWLSA